MLVPYFKSVAIWKRSAKRRPRPAWEDVAPRTQEGRNAYAVAARNEKKFSQAYLAALSGLLDEKKRRDFETAWRSNSVNTVLSSIPFFAESDGKHDVWTDFLARIKTAYYTIARETSDVAANAIQEKFGKKVVFNYVTKAVNIHPSGRIMVESVPVNPRSLKWIDERALQLVREGLSKQQREVVTSIIQDGFGKGLHPSVAFDSIKQNIGLTSREYKAVENRRALLEEKGFQPEDVREETDAYREELRGVRAERIARTETMYAESEGRKSAWQAASDAGVLPAVQRVWMSPPPSASPNRPCSICLSLDGTTAPLNGAYESPELDEPVPGPPAHPNCGCTETIVEAEAPTGGEEG
jgi:hypothetical protein